MKHSILGRSGRTAQTCPGRRDKRVHRPRKPAAAAAPAQLDADPAQQRQRRPALPPPVTSPSQLPAALRNVVATLAVPNPTAPGGETQVWLLGVSHVSRVSCEQVSELISAVQPEVVLVELCKDRVGLLADRDGRVPDVWHCRRILFEGLPEAAASEGAGEEAAAAAAAAAAEWPAAEALRTLLTCRPGRPVATRDIEDDCITLLSTGLFGRVRPAANPPSPSDACAFGLEPPEGEAADGGAGRLVFVAPLGSIRFVVEPRVLPPPKALSVRVDSSLRGATVDAAALDGAAAEAMARVERGAGAIETYLWLRNRLVALCGGDGVARVAFTGVERGAMVEALVRAPRASDPPYVSGLEGSAVGGEGAAIDAFRPQRSTVPLTPRMQLPAESLAAISARRARGALGALARTQDAGTTPRTATRTWTEEEVAAGVAAAETEAQVSPVSKAVETFGRLLTGSYARLQGRAAMAAGVETGAAWRAALEAAARTGAQQVVLGDLPASISERRLAQGVVSSAAGRLAAAAGVVAAAAVASSSPALEPLAAVAGTGGAGASAAVLVAGAGAAAALLQPLVAPFVEAWQFSRLSGEEVEATVAPKAPLSSDLDTPFVAWGEDALLRWPGAMTTLVAERDDFMARVTAAAAAGAPCGAPALVATDVEGRLLLRWMAPEGAPAAAAPPGCGDGQYAPLGGARALVAVVGSAHVRGMCRRWGDAVEGVRAGGGAQLDALLRD